MAAIFGVAGVDAFVLVPTLDALNLYVLACGSLAFVIQYVMALLVRPVVPFFLFGLSFPGGVYLGRSLRRIILYVGI